MSHKQLWAQGCRGATASHILKGCGRIPLAAKYNENRAFSPQKGAVAQHNSALFQPLMEQIRYLADQWDINRIFSPINEFCAR